MRFVVLLGPTCFAVFLATHGGMGVELNGALAFLDALVRVAVVALARGVHKTGIYDATFAGDDASALEHLAEGVEELASAFAAFGLKALFEVPERFGVRDEVLHLVLFCGSVSCPLTRLSFPILQRATWGFEVCRDASVFKISIFLRSLRLRRCVTISSNTAEVLDLAGVKKAVFADGAKKILERDFPLHVLAVPECAGMDKAARYQVCLSATVALLDQTDLWGWQAAWLKELGQERRT